MSAEKDGGDGQLVSSSEDSDVQTPQAPAAALSTPDSQHRSAMPLSASGSAVANANGKRPLNTISNGADENDDLVMMHATLKPRQEFPVKTHERSGYSWNREEDAPDHEWQNKKALDEYQRAWDLLAHKDHMVRGRWGDPFEMADREQAMLNSLKQK